MRLSLKRYTKTRVRDACKMAQRVKEVGTHFRWNVRRVLLFRACVLSFRIFMCLMMGSLWLKLRRGGKE